MNWEQRFLPKAQLSNIWYGNCKRGWEWKNAEGKIDRGTKVKCTRYRRKDMVVDKKICEEEKRQILCPECRTGRKVLWKNWGVAVHRVRL